MCAPIHDAAARWEARPGLARLVRATAMLAPVVASTITVFALSRLVPRPSPLWPQAAWWAGSLLAGSLSLVGAERLARRLLPLAALLRLSLVFPDAAPPRFGLALRQGTLRNLQRDPAARASTPGDVAAEMARLVTELSAHDRRTRGHTERVRAYSALIGEQLRLDRSDADRLQWAALLHDIGKLSVPGEILNKPGKLDDAEFTIIKGHPGAAQALLEPLRDWLGDWVGAAAEHHERYDGAGYPRGLAGTEISLAGRIVAVADAFDVMTSARSYKRPWDPATARAELTRCAGTHFDPMVVRAFLNVSLGGLRRVLGPLAWLSNLPVLGSVSTAPIGSVGASVASASVATSLSVASATILPLVAAAVGFQLPGTHPVERQAETLLARTDTGTELRFPEPTTTTSRSNSTVLVTVPQLAAAGRSADLAATSSTTTPTTGPPTTTEPVRQASTTSTATTTTTTHPAPTTTLGAPPAPPPGTTTTSTTTTVPESPAPLPGTTATSTTDPPTTTIAPTTSTSGSTTTTPGSTTTSSSTTTTTPASSTTTSGSTTTTASTTTTSSTTTATAPTTTTTAPGPTAVDDSWTAADLSHSGTQNLSVRANDSGSSIRVIAVDVTTKIALIGDADVEVHNDDVRLRVGGGFWGILVFTYTIEDSLGHQSTAQGTIILT